jgi:hypothetical protein
VVVEEEVWNTHSVDFQCRMSSICQGGLCALCMSHGWVKAAYPAVGRVGDLAEARRHRITPKDRTCAIHSNKDVSSHPLHILILLWSIHPSATRGRCHTATRHAETHVCLRMDAPMTSCARTYVDDGCGLVLGGVQPSPAPLAPPSPAAAQARTSSAFWSHSSTRE